MVLYNRVIEPFHSSLVLFSYIIPLPRCLLIAEGGLVLEKILEKQTKTKKIIELNSAFL